MSNAKYDSVFPGAGDLKIKFYSSADVANPGRVSDSPYACEGEAASTLTFWRLVKSDGTVLAYGDFVSTPERLRWWQRVWAKVKRCLSW